MDHIHEFEILFSSFQPSKLFLEACYLLANISKGVLILRGQGPSAFFHALRERVLGPYILCLFPSFNHYFLAPLIPQPHGLKLEKLRLLGTSLSDLRSLQDQHTVIRHGSYLVV
nr:hypothetical protein CFP56_46447 [Quercus suber]